MCNILKFAENPEYFQTQNSFEFIDFNNYYLLCYYDENNMKLHKNCQFWTSLVLKNLAWNEKNVTLFFWIVFFICIQKVAFEIEVGIEIHFDIAIQIGRASYEKMPNVW